MLAESSNSNRKLMESISEFTDDSLEKHFDKVQNFWHSKQAEILSGIISDSFSNFVMISNMLMPPLVTYAPYPSCMLYLFMAEGVYMNSLRDVLVWKELSKGCDIQNNLLKLNFYDLHNCLKSEFWTRDYAPHVRNAIAHNHFHVLPDKSIRFQDIDRLGHVCECKLSLQDLQSKTLFMRDVYFAVFANRSYVRLYSCNPDLR